ncbi:GNAT family N-acetyltransferase [Celerinatantimonas yamalensis]|uniref:GNAT family N-acetyltransferase n=1 Tax=Celerinatantimonas yamalensis TaxID=559956 RepID=A0ABW9G453_9GAMM
MSSVIPLTIKHIEQLGRLNQQLLEDEGNSKNLSHSYLCQRMRGWLKDANYFGFGCVIEGQIAAYILACYEDDFIYVRQLVTDREYRRQGHASKLLQHIETYLGSAKQIRLDVLMNNQSAMFFYAKLGFKPFYMAMIKHT